MGPIWCSAMLSYYPPPSPKSELPRCFSSLLHYQGSYFIICLLAVLQPAGGPMYEIYQQYIYKCESLPGVIKFGINGLHRQTCRQEIYHYKTGSMHFRRPPLNGNVYELKVRKLGSAKLNPCRIQSIR